MKEQGGNLKKTALLIFFCQFIFITSVGLTTEDVSLGEILTVAADANPATQAAWYEYLAAAELSTQSRTMPDPMIMYEKNKMGSGSTERMTSISQKLHYPGRLSARGKVFDSKAAEKKIRYESEVQDLVAQIKKAYADLWFYNRAADIAQKNKMAVDILAAKTLSDDNPNPNTVQLILRARQQQEQIVNDLLVYKELAVSAQAQLNALLDRDLNIKIIPSGLPEIAQLSLDDASKLIELAKKHSNLVKSVRKSVETARANQSYTRFESRPDFTIRYDKMKMDTPAMQGSARTGDGYALQINLPVWRQRIRSVRNAANKDLKAQKHRLTLAKNSTSALIKRLIIKMNNAQRLVELYRDNLVPRAKIGLSAADSQFDSSVRTMPELIEAQSVLYAFELAKAKAMLDRFKLFVDIELAVGVIPGTEGEEDE